NATPETQKMQNALVIELARTELIRQLQQLQQLPPVQHQPLPQQPPPHEDSDIPWLPDPRLVDGDVEMHFAGADAGPSWPHSPHPHSPQLPPLGADWLPDQPAAELPAPGSPLPLEKMDSLDFEWPDSPSMEPFAEIPDRED